MYNTSMLRDGDDVLTHKGHATLPPCWGVHYKRTLVHVSTAHADWLSIPDMIFAERWGLCMGNIEEARQNSINESAFQGIHKW